MRRNKGAAAFPGQAELAHLEATFHGFLASLEATRHLPASASLSDYATDTGKVRECLLRLIAGRHKDSQTLKGAHVLALQAVLQSQVWGLCSINKA